MGSDDHGERVAVLETQVKHLRDEVTHLRDEIQKLMNKAAKWTLQELLIFTSVLGTLAAVVAKGLGWTP